MEKVETSNSESTLFSLKSTEPSILHILGQAAPFFQKIFPLDTTIGVTDREKFLYYYSGTELNLGDLLDKPIPQDGLIPETLKTGMLQSGTISKEVYGISFKTTVIPIEDKNNKIIGTLNIGINLSTQDTLLEVSETIQSSSGELASSAQEIASSAQLLLNNIMEVQSFTKDIVKYINETGKILNFVNQIAGNSKLLGLNAAIEAARAGEQGRGFSVVAHEIQKMSTDSKDAVTNIKALLQNINDISEKLLDKVNETTDISQSQASTTEEISASAQELSECTSNIIKVAQLI